MRPPQGSPPLEGSPPPEGPLRPPPALVPAEGRAVVLIDGGSGSGKTVLAQRLAAGWPRPVQTVSLDSVYPGWDGLAAGSAAVARDLLRAGDPGHTRWDWSAGRPAEWVPLDPGVDVIVEGCGALTPANRALATAGIWVVGGEQERRERALARDGAVFAPHWERWAAQERAHWRAHRPRALADWWFVDGVLHHHRQESGRGAPAEERRGVPRPEAARARTPCGTMGRRPGRASPP